MVQDKDQWFKTNTHPNPSETKRNETGDAQHCDKPLNYD